MKDKKIDFFLGCSSPEGFSSFFSELYGVNENRRAYIIKGGPGTGKSTLMKKIASNLEARGYTVQRIHCSSDPDSLDAVICQELEFCIADGTSPHVIEPQYPGAVETIINLGDYWDKNRLSADSGKIIAECERNSRLHERCKRFLSAAGKVRYDTQRLSEDAVLEYKIHAYADRFAKRRFKKAGETAGREKKIFLSALTPKGTVFFSDTVKSLADEVILFDDKTVLVSGMLFEELKNLALRNGYDVISCFCPMQPEGYPEHIIIPALSLAFIRKHECYNDIDACRTVHSERFIDSDKLMLHKNRLAFNRRIMKELLGEAVLSLREAKKVHDEIERYYIPAMDFSALDMTQKRILSEIL